MTTALRQGSAWPSTGGLTARAFIQQQGTRNSTTKSRLLPPIEGGDSQREQAASGPRLSPSRAATAGETPPQLATSTRLSRAATAGESRPPPARA